MIQIISYFVSDDSIEQTRTQTDESLSKSNEAILYIFISGCTIGRIMTYG